MQRFSGTCLPLAAVDVSWVATWIEAIPLSEWPQQNRLKAGYPYPAMVADPEWHAFGRTVYPLVMELIEHFPEGFPDHQMLSIVMPGQKIARHDDKQNETWRVRVHVPLVTNSEALMFFDGGSVHMERGQAYIVNTEVPHWLGNGGSDPRIHFFFDVRET